LLLVAAPIILINFSHVKRGEGFTAAQYNSCRNLLFNEKDLGLRSTFLFRQLPSFALTNSRVRISPLFTQVRKVNPEGIYTELSVGKTALLPPLLPD
jgi:hypothetical protein